MNMPILLMTAACLCTWAVSAGTVQAQSSPRHQIGVPVGPPGERLFRRVPPTEQVSPLSERLEQKLREEQKFRLGSVSFGELVAELSRAIKAPVYFEPHTELTGIDEQTSVSLETSGMPLELELKKALRPHALQAIAHEGALLITADTTQLARRGIGTSRYINVDDSYMQELEEKLAQPFSQRFNQIPLEDAVRIISQEAKIKMVIDDRALEDVGLTRDLPVTINLSDVELYGFLQHMLKEADLALQPTNGFVEITTAEEAEQNPISRAYWLDATGTPPHVTAETIQIAVAPDSWGIPANIATVSGNEHGRTMLVILTTYAVHRDIEMLLQTMRRGVIDPRAVYQGPEFTGPLGPGGYFMSGDTMGARTGAAEDEGGKE